MPAPIPPAKQLEIAELRRKGKRYNEIAALAKVSEGTARRYGKLTDEDLAVEHAAAASLTAHEVAKMKSLLAQINLAPCPTCSETLVTYAWQSRGDCQYCGGGWTVDEPKGFEEGDDPGRPPLHG